MRIVVRIANLRQIQKDMKEIQDGIRRGIRNAILKGLLLWANQAATYPPPPANSTYRRTGTLGRKWTTTKPKIMVTQQFYRGWIGNNVSYAPYVQSRQRQAWMHKGRWQTVEDIMEKGEEEVLRIFEAEIRKEIGG